MNRAQKHYTKAQILEEKGQIEKAMRHYQWSARAYYPFSHVGERAVKRLWDLGQNFVKSNQTEQALHALDLLRGAIWSTRWLFQPYQGYQKKVDEQIAVLRAGDIKQLNLLQALRDDPRPSMIRSMLLLLSIISFFLSGIYSLFKGFSPELEKNTEATRLWLVFLCSMVGIFFSLMPSL